MDVLRTELPYFDRTRDVLECGAVVHHLTVRHDSMAASVASALISSRVDQLNFILYGTPLKHTACLQRIQHAAVRVILYQRSRTLLSSNELLKQSPPQTNIWISCFSVFCSKILEFITCQYS